jgi:hypothetical protein
LSLSAAVDWGGLRIVALIEPPRNAADRAVVTAATELHPARVDAVVGQDAPGEQVDQRPGTVMPTDLP